MLNPGMLVNLLDDSGTIHKFGVGCRIELSPEYSNLSWDQGLPLPMLEEMVYAWASEIKEIARSLGREVNSPDQYSMVKGVFTSYKILAGSQRARGVPVDNPPPKTNDICEEERVGGAPEPVTLPAKKDVVVLLGTSNFKDLTFRTDKAHTIVRALPGYDFTKGNEERIDKALEEAALLADEYWGENRGSHRVIAVYLCIFGNGSLKMVKNNSGNWVVGEDAFAKAVLRARGYKRNLTTSIILELIEGRFGEVKTVAVPPLPRAVRDFSSEANCTGFFEEYENEVCKMAVEMEIGSVRVMEHLGGHGLMELLAPDQIHWTDKGRAIIRAVICKHIETNLS